jgi:hypothetical protein
MKLFAIAVLCLELLAAGCASAPPAASSADHPATALPGAYSPRQLAAQWRAENEAQEQRLAQQARDREAEEARQRAEAEREAREAREREARQQAEAEAREAAESERIRLATERFEREESLRRSKASQSPEPAVDVSESASCCKICRKGCACGNSCISCSKTCHKGAGCACDAE